MSKIELAELLAGSVDWIIASETGIPLTSWPYQDILQAVSDKPRITPEQFGRAIVDGYCSRYTPKGVSLTMLNLQRGSPVFAAVNQLAAVLLQSVTDPAERLNLRKTIETTSHDEVEPMIDLQELCSKLKAGSADSTVRDAADRVLQLLARPFIAKQGRKGPGVGRFRGVGVYVPRILYDPALGRPRLRELFNWRPQSSPLPPGVGETWTQLVQQLVSAEISSSQHDDRS
jgi:hypothetical protein